MASGSCPNSRPCGPETCFFRVATWASSRLDKSTPVIDYGAQDFCFRAAFQHPHNPQLPAARGPWSPFALVVAPASCCFSLHRDWPVLAAAAAAGIAAPVTAGLHASVSSTHPVFCYGIGDCQSPRQRKGQSIQIIPRVSFRRPHLANFDDLSVFCFNGLPRFLDRHGTASS